MSSIGACQHHGKWVSTQLYNLSLYARKPTIWVPTRSDTNRLVQSQKQAKSLTIGILVKEELYYRCCETKGADQLCSYCTADLRLCFRIWRLLFFGCSGSFMLRLRWATFSPRPYHLLINSRTWRGRGQNDTISVL